MKGAVVHVSSKSIQGFKMEMRELLIGTKKKNILPDGLLVFGLPSKSSSKYDLVLQNAIRIKMF